MENTTKTKKWEEVYTALASEIETGGYKTGDRFYTISEVSEKFMVSPITSRKALSVLAGKNIVIQKPRLGTIIKHAGRKKKQISFFIPGKENAMDFGSLPLIYYEILKGAIQEASKEGFEIEFMKEEDFFKNGRTEPLLIFYSGENLCAALNASGRRKNDFVLLHSPKPLMDFHTVRHNLRKAAYAATAHLLSRGHERIGFISGSLKKESSLPRFEGYLDALKEKGMPLDLQMIRETSGQRKDTINVMERFLSEEKPPTAIFAGNDTRALDVLEYCRLKTIKVPEELAVCGIDNIYESQISEPALTTVDTGWAKIGEEGVKFIISGKAESSNFQDIVIEPELIIRDST